MNKLKQIFLFSLIITFISCQHKKKAGIEELPVAIDEKFTQLFHQDSGGLTGADGTISVPMPDGSSVFMMGDSFLGEVVDNKRDPNTFMLNNTFVIVNPEQTAMKTLYQGTYENAQSFIIPPNDPGKFYWPGHGFVRDSVFHFFMSRFWTPNEGMWGFEFLSTDYLRYSWPDFEPISNEPFEYTLQNNVHWGHAVLDNGDFIYIYGCRPNEDKLSQAYVCRTVVNNEKDLEIENVEFYDGNGWASDPLAVKPMDGTSSNISEQFSVFKYNDKYVLLSQQRGIGTGEIYTYTSKNPIGPWGNKQQIYRTTEHEEDDEIITYNAMAHPQYIEDGKLLICYNVNSLKVARVHENVNYYRPVFLRVPMEMIMGTK